jgi:tmRNA-binding protein
VTEYAAFHFGLAACKKKIDERLKERGRERQREAEKEVNKK